MPNSSYPDQNHIFPENPNTQPHQNGYSPVLGDENNLENQGQQLPTNSQAPHYPSGQGNEIYNRAPVYTPPFATTNSTQTPNSNNTQNFEPHINLNNNQSHGSTMQEQDVMGPNQYFQVAGKPNPEQMKRNGKQGPNKFLNFILNKWWLVLILILGVALTAVGLYGYTRKKPTQVVGAFDKLETKIEAPKSSPSGSPANWKITLKNREDVSLTNVVLSLNFDRTFKFSQVINPTPSKPDGSEFKIARLDPAGMDGSEIIIQFEGILTGNIDEETLINGSVSFIPEPLIGQENNRRVVQVAAAKTKITQQQVKISILPTENEVQNGGEAEINIVFQNTSEREIKDIRIRTIYPDKGGFSYTSSILQTSSDTEPKTKPDDGNNTWYITTLPRLKDQTLKIKGKVFGQDGVNLTFGVSLDIKAANSDYLTLAQTSRDIKVISQPLAITTRIENRESDKLFSPGETLSFVIDYKNMGAATLRNVEILASVDDPANIIDYNSFSYTGGERGNVSNRTVQWRGNNIPKLVNLSPQDGGQLRYTLRVIDADALLKSGLPQNTFVVTPKVSARAQNLQPVDFSGSSYKALGLLIYEQKVVSKGIDPLNKNKETFTVTFTLKTRQTQVNDITIKTITPLRTNTWQPASILPAKDASKITYNQETGEIIWRPGNVPGYAGLNNNPAVSISFDLVVEAEQNTSTKGATLFNPPLISGVDDFTGQKYDLIGQQGVSA